MKAEKNGLSNDFSQELLNELVAQSVLPRRVFDKIPTLMKALGFPGEPVAAFFERLGCFVPGASTMAQMIQKGYLSLESCTTMAGDDCVAKLDVLLESISAAEAPRQAAALLPAGSPATKVIATSAGRAFNDVPAERAPSAVGLGTMVGRYEIGRALGHERSSCFEAKDVDRARTVAVKIVRGADLEAGAAGFDALLFGLRAAASFEHENCLMPLASGRQGSFVYVATPLLNEGSLWDRVDKRGPLGHQDAARTCVQLSRGLKAAHSAGLVHGGVKPSNVFLDGSIAKLSDFLTAVQSSGADLIPDPGSNPRLHDRDVVNLGQLYHFMVNGRPPDGIRARR